MASVTKSYWPRVRALIAFSYGTWCLAPFGICCSEINKHSVVRTLMVTSLLGSNTSMQTVTFQYACDVIIELMASMIALYFYNIHFHCEIL